jgi:hypothetical protein
VSLCLVAAVIFGIWGLPIVFAIPAKNAWALFLSDASISDLPQQVRISLDGSNATFHKGSPDYEALLCLLRTAKGEDAQRAAGPYPPFSSRARCGKFVIPYYLIPFRYRLYRSTTNPNYLWIALPHRGGISGRTYPTILDSDGQLLNIVRTTAAGKDQPSRK